MNLTDNRLVGIATVGWELLGNYDSIRISEQNKSRLVKLMSVWKGDELPITMQTTGGSGPARAWGHIKS